MRTLLCFGDSNTWGYIPGSNGRRFPREVRWPVRLQLALGDDWEVIAEGLNGRTATHGQPGRARAATGSRTSCRACTRMHRSTCS